MEIISIEIFVKAMKQRGLTRAKGILNSGVCAIDLDGLTISYQGQILPLKKIPGTLGGWRYFFLCPACGRSCRKLFRPADIFACGKCHDIYKKTLNRSKTDCVYFWELAAKEARKVDPNFEPIDPYYSYRNFPKRPKNMHYVKYWNYWRKFWEYMEKGDNLWL